MAFARLRLLAQRKPTSVAFGSVALYVVAATISVLCLFPPYYSSWVMVVLIATLPVSFFGFGIAFAGGLTAISILFILGIHLLVGAVYALIAASILRSWAERSNQSSAA